MDNNKVYIFRLNPGEDLRKSIEAFVKEKNIIAGWINTCVGSLTIIQYALPTNRKASVVPVILKL